MSDFEITGADQMLRLSKALKAAGRTELRKELNKGLRKATKPLIAQTRVAALATLPYRGGLAAQVAREPQRVQVKTGRDPGVRIVVGQKRGGAQAADAGSIRHPVFGRDEWVEQSVTPGWFSDTLDEQAEGVLPDLEEAVEKVMSDVVQQTGIRRRLTARASVARRR